MELALVMMFEIISKTTTATEKQELTLIEVGQFKKYPIVQGALTYTYLGTYQNNMSYYP